MRRLTLTAGLFGLLLPLAPAAADPMSVAEAVGPVPLVRLDLPRQGSVLAAGSVAELEWAPAEGLGGLEEAEEWEAFLSVDGGATYPVRITPHLDLGLRRVAWTVPALPARDARILLRFGDERRETAWLAPQRFSIAPAPRPGAELPAIAFGRGEPALPGQAGVVSWEEGPRRGGLQRRVAAVRPPGLRGASAPPDLLPSEALADPEESPSGSPIRSYERTALPPPSSSTAGSLARGASLRATDILLLTSRRNE